MTREELFIDGRWVPAGSGGRRPILNPHDASELCRVAEGSREDARAAIQAARRAFDRGAWPRTPATERAEMVSRLADAVRRHRDELARLETLDTGKTLEESGWDMDDVAAVLDYFAGLGRGLSDEALDSPHPNSESRLAREPVGVCGQISPWNYPLLQASWKLAPALVAGCTVVIKPSELTPLTTLRLTELAQEVGFPPGVINTVTGAGPAVGAELAESPDVDLISFTGGVRTGREVMRAATGNLKRIALELGGKNPHIIFEDADLDTALDNTLNAVFFHAGQICSAGSRLLLHASIADGFVERLAERMAAIRLGSGLDPETRMGPLISAEHRAGVADKVDRAVEEGARLLTGGAPPENEALARGFYYRPTLLDGCEPNMAATRDEIFGPVITVERFADEEEAVARANDTEYGLSGGFQTRDAERMERVSRALRFGTVWVNDYNVYFPAAPWGGYKRSGIGRELGPQGLDEYLEVKHIYHNLAPKPMGWF